MNEGGILGVYASPDAVMEQPEYAKRLVETAGVNQFVLRTGFDPDNHNPALAGATDLLRDLGAQVLFLAGTWWGAAEAPPRAGSHESRFPMVMPGSEADATIHRSLRKMCESFRPDGICLTHARYRHPAYIEGVFDTGDAAYRERMAEHGVRPEGLAEALRSFYSRLPELSHEALLALADDRCLIGFLDAVAGCSLFAEFFRFRCMTVMDSLTRFRETVLASGVRIFGTNAYSPIAARLCGQDYGMLGDVCDFLQPLLGYVRWHVLQPIAAWASLLARHGRATVEQAVEVSAKLFALDGAGICDSALRGDGEGDSRLVREVVSREFALVRDAARCGAIVPILRGKDWDAQVTDSLRSRAGADFAGVVFQGCQYLAAPATHPGWN